MGNLLLGFLDADRRLARRGSSLSAIHWGLYALPDDIQVNCPVSCNEKGACNEAPFQGFMRHG
jgi:hypothetical protein